MASAQLQTIFSGAGISINSIITLEGSGQVAAEPPAPGSLPAAAAGSLTTRTDDNTGVVTLSGGHGIVNGKVDVYWADGIRYGMDAVVTVNAVAIDLGAGDVLPAGSTAVVMDQQEQLDIGFDGDNMVLIAASMSKRGHVDFQTAAGASLFAHEFDAGEVWSWYETSGIARPITGDPVAKAIVSNGDSANANTQKIGVLYNA